MTAWRWDRQLVLCVLISACVLIPRGAMIMRQHGENTDTEYHLRRGLAFAMGYRSEIATSSNDPPLGQMLLALPMIVAGCHPEKPICDWSWPEGELKPGQNASTPEQAAYERRVRKEVLYGHRLRPETLLLLIGVWKSILFLPCAAVVFLWVRRVFGLAGGWLSLALLLIDPTFAAHVPIAALDSLAITGIVAACSLMWRYFEDEKSWRLALAAIATVAAILMKHTAVLLPIIFVIYAIWWWLWLPYRKRVMREEWRTHGGGRRAALALALLSGFAAMWVLLLFDFSRPIDQIWQLLPTQTAGGELNWFYRILQQRMPCGAYLGCFVSGYLTNKFAPQPAYLWGEISTSGFWYYFPVLMTYKVPIGIGIVLLLALATLVRRKTFPGESSIVIPLFAFTVFLLTARMNYSFRHFLPAYVFMLMWAGGRVASAGRTWLIAGWVAVAAAALHAISFHPNYLSYINWPRHNIHLQITDSNLDWGQALRQAPDWAKRHAPDRKVYVIQDTGLRGINGAYWIGKHEPQIEFLVRRKPLPHSGLLVINPAYACGAYDEPGKNFYHELTKLKPVGWVGDAMPVFDLDQLPRK